MLRLYSTLGNICLWENVNFKNKTLKVEQAITQESKLDSDGKVAKRVTIIGDTKTTCSIREIPIADIVVETLKEWQDKQILRQNSSKEITSNLISKTSFIFANDNGSVRSYYGTKSIFDRFKKRNDLNKYHIGFHGLRHTFSNMLFEMNENPKAIQQLLSHRDVKTTITVYNSVDNEYIKHTTDKFNEKVKEEQMVLDKQTRGGVIEERKDKLVKDMTDEEFDAMLQQLMKERKENAKEKVIWKCKFSCT